MDKKMKKGMKNMKGKKMKKYQMLDIKYKKYIIIYNIYIL